MDDQPLLRQLTERAPVKGHYLCARKSTFVARNGRPYLSLTLSDRSGSLEARVWERAEEVAKEFDELDVVAIEGTAVPYQGRIQLHVTKVHRAPGTDFDPGAFLPSSPFPVDEMWRDLQALASSVTNQPLRTLVSRVLDDPEIATALRRSPAAKTVHHASLGGLLEHTLSVTRLVDAICAHYAATSPGLIDRDVAVAGAILHDLGKTRELGWQGGFTYSDQGRLLGHIVLGASMLEEKLREVPDCPSELALRLRHVVLAHHGELQFGSPKRPKTMEAFIVHYADQIDCHAGFLRDLFEREGQQRWTSYQRIYDRYFFRGPLDEHDGHDERNGGDEGDE